METAHFSLTKENQGDGDGSTPGKDKEEYRKLLAASMHIGEQGRVLAFKHKAPAPPEGHQGGLAGLYSSNLGPAPSRKHFRHVPQTQERILDAPDLVDDYYLNLLDWNSNNVVREGCNSGGGACMEAHAPANPRGPHSRTRPLLHDMWLQIAVALGATVYLWNASSGTVEELCTCRWGGAPRQRAA